MCHVHSTKPFNLEVVWGDHTKIREECICKVVWNGFSKVTSKNNFQAFSVISPGMAVSSILQIRFDRTKDCNTIQGGERINSRVIRSDCYSFRVLSYPDSSTISGKDTSCPNKIISQVSWLKWTCSKGRVPGGAQHPALHTTSTMDTDHCAGGMSHFGGWEKWSCSDSGTTAEKLPNLNNSVLSLEKRSTCILQLEFNEYFWQRPTYEGHFMDSINNF